MAMGYMGFGLRKEEYTRKPKKVFGQEKEIYGENLERYPKVVKSKSVNPYFMELEAFKNKRRFRAKISESIVGMLMTLSIIVIIYTLFLWLSERL